MDIFLSTLYYINELMRRLGFLPLMLFLAGVLLWDTGNNGGYIGQLLSLGSKYFFGFTVSSFTLFMFIVASIVVWFWAKTHEIIK